MNLNYPEEFKRRAKEEYPDAHVLHVLLDRGKCEQVGKYLRSVTPKGVAVEDVLGASSLEEIREEALRIRRKQSLYREWEEIRDRNR